jgi:hypothetical protein
MEVEVVSSVLTDIRVRNFGTPLRGQRSAGLSYPGRTTRGIDPLLVSLNKFLAFGFSKDLEVTVWPRLFRCCHLRRYDSITQQ